MESEKIFLEWYQDPMAKDIERALRNAIKFHGPITKNHSKLNSAVKRVYGVFKGFQKGQYDICRQRTHDNTVHKKTPRKTKKFQPSRKVIKSLI